MPSRAMIVVGGGSSRRFGSDKLLAEVKGRPLISHTIESVIDHVDKCVVVCRSDTLEPVASEWPDVVVTPGGTTRTASEMAGLAALGDGAALIGIHDAARPLVRGHLIDQLFRAADQHGGAIPVLDANQFWLDRKSHRLAEGVMRAQTPQVFRAEDLMASYVRAARAGFEGHDTAEVVMEFSDTTVVALPGDPSNMKVTYPGDLETVAELIKAGLGS